MAVGLLRRVLFESQIAFFVCGPSITCTFTSHTVLATEWHFFYLFTEDKGIRIHSSTLFQKGRRGCDKNVSACSNSAFCLTLGMFVASEYLQFILDITVPIYCYRTVFAVAIVCVALKCPERALLRFTLEHLGSFVLCEYSYSALKAYSFFSICDVRFMLLQKLQLQVLVSGKTDQNLRCEIRLWKTL